MGYIGTGELEKHRGTRGHLDMGAGAKGDREHKRLGRTQEHMQVRQDCGPELESSSPLSVLLSALLRPITSSTVALSCQKYNY